MTSSRAMMRVPSRRSMNRSSTFRPFLARFELTHFVKVRFCTSAYPSFPRSTRESSSDILRGSRTQRARGQ